MKKNLQVKRVVVEEDSYNKDILASGNDSTEMERRFNIRRKKSDVENQTEGERVFRLSMKRAPPNRNLNKDYIEDIGRIKKQGEKTARYQHLCEGIQGTQDKLLREYRKNREKLENFLVTPVLTSNSVPAVERPNKRQYSMTNESHLDETYINKRDSDRTISTINQFRNHL